MLSYRPVDFSIPQWHLLLCKPNQNHIAFRSLKKLNFDLFMPHHRVKRLIRGQAASELRPVFGGYLFLAADPSRPRWHQVKAAPGISQIIGFGQSGPAIVHPDVVAGLMYHTDQNGVLRKHADDFAVGDKIRIISGPFADFITSVEKIAPDDRLNVLLELLGRRTSMLIDKRDCKSVSRAAGIKQNG